MPTARETKVGINIATSGSWALTPADAMAVGASDGHYLRDDVDIQLRQQLSRDDSATQSFIGSIQVSNAEAIAAQLPMFLHYHDVFQNILFALALGTGGTAPTQIGATTGYTNTFEPATTRANLYATIVRDKVQYIAEVPGALFHGFEIRVGDMGRMEVDWMFTGDTEISTSTINTSTQVAALTFPTLGRRWFWKDAAVRLNVQSAGALGSSDTMKFTSMRLRFDQPIDVKFVGGQATIIEPKDNGFPTCTLELTFARFDATSDDFFAAHRDGTRYKADVIFTGPVIEGTAIYGLMFQFPNLQVMAFAAPFPNTQQGEPTISFEALSATVAPTGMTVTKPIRVTTTGIMSTNPFA